MLYVPSKLHILEVKYLKKICSFIIDIHFCGPELRYCNTHEVGFSYCTISSVQFPEALNAHPVFLLHATLMIPRVVVRPSLEDVQEALVAAGKLITSVSKGVGQWTGGKSPQVLDI